MHLFSPPKNRLGCLDEFIDSKKFSKVIKHIRTNWQLYVLLLPAIIYTIVICYKPMYGIIIAFKDYSPRKGIWASE